MVRNTLLLLILLLLMPFPNLAEADVVINELHYNPPGRHLESGVFYEFVEIYNPDERAIDISGYFFGDGIEYVFPPNTQIASHSYLIVVKGLSRWPKQNVLGPYGKKLADSGETVELYRPDGTLVERIDYSDEFPWPLGADGYGSSLERIAWDLPSNDYHTWRSSLNQGGTPGRENSVEKTPPYPLILRTTLTPEHPTSEDAVAVQITFDGAEVIENVSLRYETPSNTNQPIDMELLSQTRQLATYQATLPAQDTQTLVWMNTEVHLDDGQHVLLPHEAEPNPFHSYFVYDGEIESTLPILWLLPPKQSSLLTHNQEISAAVHLPVGSEHVDVFDGALVIPSSNQKRKVRFLKGEEFYGDRTINIIPEIPTGGTNAGISSPYREHLGYWFYSEMNVPTPWSGFFRVIELPLHSNGRHSQNLIFQQINELFLKQNGRDPDADLYKLVYTDPNWEKHTNKEEGHEKRKQLLRDLQTSNPEQRRQVIETRLNVEEFMNYSAASIFVSNWDGYWNNNWMYLDPQTQIWEIYPWDLDWCWGATPPPNEGPMYSKMPLSFPLDGVAVGDTRVSRPPGPVTAPLHKDGQFYEALIQKLANQIDQHFAEDKLFMKMDETQQLLIDDLQLMRQQTGRDIRSRRQQIIESYNTIKEYVKLRRQYLKSVLPQRIIDWQNH